MTPRSPLLLAAALALAPLLAEAQGMSTFRCQGKDGKKYYGNTVPPQCYGRLVEQLNKQGMVIKRIDPDASDKDVEAKAREKVEKEKRDAVTRETTRRDRALLATYTSEKDVDEARRRALEGNELQMKEIEGKIAALQKRRSSKKEDAKNVDIDLKAQEGLLATKRKEVEMINARYDDEKKRYGDLTRRK